METRRAGAIPGIAKAFFETALLPWRTGLERDTKVMLVNISLDADRVARTDVPSAELLIVGGNHDVGRVWQAFNVEMRRRASARWGRRRGFNVEHAPDHIVLRAADAEHTVVALGHGRLGLHGGV